MKKQVILLIILNGEKWYYFAVKRLSALLRRITSKHHKYLYLLNYLHSFATEDRREFHEKVWENKDFCDVVMPSKDTKILEFSQYQTSDKAPFIIYADLECLIEKIDGSKNNSQNLLTVKIRKHIPWDFSVPTISSFKSIKNKHDVYRGKYCMKEFCECLREHAVKMLNFENKKMKLWTKGQQESYESAKTCYSCAEKFENKYVKDKKYCKVRFHCHYTEEYRGTAHSIWNLRYSVPKEIRITFDNRSNYDYHFIIKELSGEFKKKFSSLGKV